MYPFPADSSSYVVYWLLLSPSHPHTHRREETTHCFNCRRSIERPIDWSLFLHTINLGPSIGGEEIPVTFLWELFSHFHVFFSQFDVLAQKKYEVWAIIPPYSQFNSKWCTILSYRLLRNNTYILQHLNSTSTKALKIRYHHQVATFGLVLVLKFRFLVIEHLQYQ